MNILVLSWRDHKHPQAGGAEQVMREHMKGWITVGHKVTLFSSRIAGYKRREEDNGIEIIRSGDQYIGVKLNAFKYWLRNGKKYDFVVDQFHGIPFFTPLYVKKPKLAVLQEIAGKVWFLNGFKFPFNYIIGFIGYVLEPAIFLFYRNIPFMVGSESAKTDLQKVGISPKNITVVPHGVIINKNFKKYQKEKIKTIVFLGALARDKGVEDAIKAFSILNQKGDYQFWIIGKGDPVFTQFVKDMAFKLGLSDQIKFWGFVTDHKKFELLSRSHILVNPSAREGWGLVNIEANAVGVPVVAYKTAGLIDSVKDGQSGVFVYANSPERIAETILSIFNDEEKYIRLQKNAVLWSEKFSWKESKKISMRLIGDIVTKLSSV